MPASGQMSGGTEVTISGELPSKGLSISMRDVDNSLSPLNFTRYVLGS